MPKISVIVPVYKVEKYLNRCVDSILNQTFKDFELILVDDGSPDNCPKTCDDYALKDSRVHVIHKENGGVSSARNTGIEYALKSDSEYVAFIDADDEVDKEYLQCLYKILIDNNADMSCCEYKTYNLDTGVTARAEKIISGSKIVSGKQVLKGNFKGTFLKNDTFVFCGSWCKLYKKELLENIRYDLGVEIAEDLLVFTKICLNLKNCAISNRILYTYFLRGDSAFHSKSAVAVNKATYDAAVKMSEYVKDNKEMSKIAFESITAYFLSYISSVSCSCDYKTFKNEKKKFNKIYLKQVIKRFFEFPLKRKAYYFILEIFPKVYYNHYHNRKNEK